MPLTIGVAVSDTSFKRPVGDVANAKSYGSNRVIFEVVRGIRADDLVRPIPNEFLLEPYLGAALKLEARGADVITTTCGFLSPLQAQIANRLKVTFIASSLLQVPLVHSLVRGRVGIITANSEALTEAYLQAAGVTKDVAVAVAGLHHYPDFAEPFLRNVGEVDLGKVELAVVRAAVVLAQHYPDIKAFVCECHNLAPFAAAIQRSSGLPVFDILSLVGFAAQAYAKSTFVQK